jgi:glycosyltransferase involved in cell wall biosynthesis
MKTICVIVNGRIQGDSRVIKVVKTLSKIAKVDVFYLDGNDSDHSIFTEDVRLFSLKKRNGRKEWILKHTFFYKQFEYFIEFVLKQNVKYDFIYANDLPCLGPAVKIKKHLNSKLIYDSHEIYLETINQFFPGKVGTFRGFINQMLISFMRAVGEKAERKFLKEVDYFITVCESLKEYFENKYNFQGIRVVMNCPYLLPEIKPNEIVNLKEKFGFSQEKFLLLFQGNLGPGKDIDYIVKAMQFTEKDIVLGILGGGTLKNNLVKLVEELNLTDKVKFHDKVPSLELYRYTCSADGGITLKDNGINLNKKLGIATKFFEYIHAGIPLISTRSVEIEIIANKFDICILVDRNIDEIVNGINLLKSVNKEEQAEKTAKASEVYNWQNQEVALLEIVK